MSTHGARANTTGKTLERIVTPILTGQYSFSVMTHRAYQEARSGLFGLPDRFIVKGFPYETLYGSRGTTEFLLVAKDAHSTTEFPIPNGVGELTCRIECKWQQSSGSVDEKFPYLYLSCVEVLPEKNIIILYGGGRFRPGAINWLKQAVREKRYMPPDANKNIVVMAVEDFMRWVNNAFGQYSK